MQLILFGELTDFSLVFDFMAFILEKCFEHMQYTSKETYHLMLYKIKSKTVKFVTSD